MTPRPFAPGIITTDDEEGSSGFARGGTVFLFQKFRDRRCHTYITRLIEGVWTAPELIPFWETMVHNGDFVISSDDRTMLYQVRTEPIPASLTICGGRRSRRPDGVRGPLSLRRSIP